MGDGKERKAKRKGIPIRKRSLVLEIRFPSSQSALQARPTQRLPRLEEPRRGAGAQPGSGLGSGCRNHARRAQPRAGCGSKESAGLQRGLCRAAASLLGYVSVKEQTLCGALPRYTERHR